MAEEKSEKRQQKLEKWLFFYLFIFTLDAVVKYVSSHKNTNPFSKFARSLSLLARRLELLVSSTSSSSSFTLLP